METIKLTSVEVKCESRTLKCKYTREMAADLEFTNDLTSKGIMRDKITRIFL